MKQPEPLTWTIHLAARHPWRAIIAVLAIILALFVINAIGQSLLLTVLAAVLLFGSIAEFMLPITYTLDPNGIHARQFFSHRTLPWAQVRWVYLRRNGIKLSPIAANNWLESYRGIFLRTTNLDATLNEIESWVSYTGVTTNFIKE